MDGTRKTLRVDDSKTLAELMLPICTKMGMPYSTSFLPHFHIFNLIGQR